MAATIVAALVAYGLSELAAYAVVYVAMMVVSTAISMALNEILSPSQSNGQVDAGSYRDPGVDSRLRINTENRVGVGYGSFWCKGAEVFGQAAANFKEAYYAVVLTEAVQGHPNELIKVFWEEYELTLKPFDTVTSVSVTNGGNYDFGARPTATVAPPTIGTTATVSVDMTDVIDEQGYPSYSYVSSVRVTNGGSGYVTAPAITFSSGAAAATSKIGEGGGWVSTAKDAAGNTVSDFNDNVRVQFFANGLPADRSGLPNLTWFQTATNALSSYTCAVLTVKYNRDKQIFSLKDMSFALKNDLNRPGDVLLDYLTNNIYGCGLPVEMVDTASLTALNTFSDDILPSTTSTGATVNAPRYRIDGVVNTNQNCWKNFEDILFSCGCYPRVNNQTGQYGAYIDKATDVVAFAFDDTTIIGQSQIVTAEFSSVPNEVEVKFNRLTLPTNGAPDIKYKGQQDTFNLSIPASVLPANSQPNQYVLEYRYIANDVQAKRLAAIDLNNNALDLSYTFHTNFKALGVVSGDVVTITSKYNGWLNKKFRVISMAEIEEAGSGNITLEFFVKEYDAAVYIDSTVVQYPPAANVNGPSTRAEQSYVPAAPVATNVDLTLPIPSLSLQFNIPANKVEDQIDIYYMVETPDISKAVFMFTVYGSQPDGSFGNGTFTFPVLGTGGLYAPQVVPPGNYYFVCKYFNDSLATEWSDVSAKLEWRPQTQQWVEQFAMLRWSVNSDGVNMSTNPDGKRYMGVYNSFNPVSPADPAQYKWFDLGSNISKSNQLFFRIFENRVLSYRLALTNPDSTLWSNAYNFPDPANPVFNLDETTGFYVKTAYQAAGQNYLTSIWNADGSITYLLPKGTSVPGTTPITEIGAISIDEQGRVVSFTQTERLYLTAQQFSATGPNQTFGFTHVIGQALFFMNGILLNPVDYTESATSVTIPSTKNGYTIMALAFRETTATGEVAPFTRVDIPTVQGQSQYAVEMNEGCQLVFINGSFLTNIDYATPQNNILELNNPPPASGQNLTVLNFRPLNAVAAPFNQAIGSTIGGNQNITLSGNVNPAFTIVGLNGSLLSDSDFNAAITFITLTSPALFTGDILEACSFLGSGPALDLLPEFPAEPQTLGSIIEQLTQRITELESQ